MKLYNSNLFTFFIMMMATCSCANETNDGRLPVEAKEELLASVVQTVEEEAHNLNFETKRKDAINLVNRGIELMQQKPLDYAFNVFTNSREFMQGELYLFVFDEQGVCQAHGQQKEYVWNNMWNYRDSFGIPVIQNLIKKAEEGGGWVTYSWRNATKVSYVKRIEAHGKYYIIGTGYYPHSKEDSVIALVRGAVALFNRSIEEERSLDGVFGAMSYAEGQFVLGDLYLYALDFEGKIVAQGDRPGLIGRSAWDVTDARGAKTNQVIIERLKESAGGIWIEYISKRAYKKAYAEKVTDKKGKHYFIACGFYPDADRKHAVDLVRLGFKFMKTQGLMLTTNMINDKRDEQFRYGDLYLEVYSVKGDCLAHGNNQELVGKNFWAEVDQDGKFYVQDIIKQGLKEPGWVDYKLRNLFKSAYVERVKLGTENYIIVCGLYPISKRESTILLVKTAVNYLSVNSREQAFYEFTKKKGKFIRGDLTIFVFDFAGLCFAYGDDHSLIWRNLLDIKDDDGKAFIRLFINTVKNGPGQVSFRLNNAKKLAYVEALEKGGKLYVVGSSYYT